MTARPLGVLIAALGGEGGGLLTDWLVAAALAADLPVQSTSIPGVAQRTGATTYYVEIFPESNAGLGGRRPLFALYPTPGAVDLVAATELLEAGRMVEGGFVTPDRTTLIAGIHRVYATVEKMQMGDGRFDAGRVLRACQEMARRPVLFDLTADAKAAGHPINAVLLGAIAGTGVLPIPRQRFEAAIREGGVAVEANLAAFAYGHGLALDPPKPAAAAQQPATLSPQQALYAEIPSGLASEELRIVQEGVKRLLDYQDIAYARLYLRRLQSLRTVAGTAAERVMPEVARHLALWMAYEDVIRVADLKSRPERLAGVREEVRAKPDQPVHVREFFKPGIAEVAALLPPRLGAALAAWAERHGYDDRLHLRMRLKSTSISGHLRLRLLAALRPWRRRSYRFAAEQERIERWLGAIAGALPWDPALAREIALCARLLKGYGDTHKRGLGNFLAIMSRVVEPALASRDPQGAESVRRAREASLADPEGQALKAVLAAE
jgi:indolepyruvate ferredoxin oxidoreductase beta subunit